MRLILLVCAFLCSQCGYNESLSRTLGYLSLVAQCKMSNIEDWSCIPCKRFPGMKNIHVFKNVTKDIVGYIGTSDELDATILVFRGTLAWDWKNWAEDINFLKTPYKRCNNSCEVHRGFLEGYAEIEPQVEEYVRKYAQLYNKTSLYVTGHSLGGALAYLAAAHMISIGFPVSELYTYGSPRVGDKRFAEWFNRANLNKFTGRVTHYQDPVPHLPYNVWGFEHISVEIFYNEAFDSYRICDDRGGEDKTCSDSITSYNAHDHETYFGIEWMVEAKACFFINGM